MAGDMSPTAVVGTFRNLLEVGEGEGDSGEGGSEQGSVGDSGIVIGIEIGIGIGPRPHAERDRGRHRGGGVPGGQWIQWGGVEWVGGLS